MNKIEYIPKYTVSGKAMRLIMEITAVLAGKRVVAASSKTVVVLAAALAAWGVDGSELKLRNVYSDKMLFQRDQPVVFAGTGDAGTTVTVKMNGAAGAAKADAAGGWRVELPPMKAGGPYEVAVTDGKTSLVLRDVLVGELWLASGQSNMEMPVWSKDPYYRLTNGLEVAAAANDPELRFLKVERKISYDGPQSELPGEPHWVRGDEPESVKPLSATGYMFARELRRRLKVPVGIIDASWGGTLIEPWIPESVLRKRGFVRDIGLLEFSRDPRRDNCPAWLFEMQKKHLDLVADWIAAVEKANAAVSQEAKANWMKPELKEDAWKSAPVTFDKPALAWFRWHVEIPAGAEDVRFEAQAVCDTDEVWFDGRKVGATDVYDPYYWKVKRRYPVGKVAAGKHVLAMRLFSHCGNSGAKGLKLVWKGGSVDLDAEMPLRRVEATPTKETGARPGYPWELGNWRIVALPDGSNIVPSSIHNAMVAPLDVFRCRGTVWYQGCSNANEWPQHPEGVGSYHGYQKALVEALRGIFARDDMAFVCVQLASFLEQTPAKRMKDTAVAAMPPSEGGYVKIRDEQTRIREVPLCDCVTAVDIGDHSDIHPKNKQEVGRRLAGAAEVLCYGGKEKTRGPEVVKTVWKDGAAEITFDEPLVLKDGKIGDHEFTFVDAAGQVAWAKGVQIAPNAVRVTCDAIRNPAHVDYCRVPFVFASSLFNRDGYPALPFAKLAVAAPMTVTLTFDDGVKGHIRYAAPIIEKYGYRGTFNIVTDWIGQEKKMSWDEVRELRRRGHEIACHTKTHRSLTDLLSAGKTNEVVRELAESRDVLKREVGVSPRFLCHPFVHASPAVDTLVRAEGMEPYACNRFNVGGDVSPAAFAKALDEWIAHGVRSKDILFHGITAETGGWKPFASERDFEACVAEISRREKAGQLRVVSYAEFRSERDRSHPLPTSSWPSAACGTSYDNKLPTSALLGNGTLGAVNGGDADRKFFVLTRGDLWSYGDGTNGKKPENIRPMSFADFEIRPGVKTVASEDTLVTETATLKTLGRFGRGNVALESFVVADEDVFVVTGQTTTDDVWAISLQAHDALTIFPRTSGVDDGSPWVRRSTVNLAPNDPHGWTTNATAALRVVGATIVDAKADGKGFASATVRIKGGMPFALVVSADSRRRFSSGDVATLRKRHIAAWADWWSRSRIEIDGDPELERWYYGQLYLLRSAVRRGAFPPGLYGPWVTTDTPAWHNDFHLNYNYVATYYGAFAANRCEIAESMPDPLLAYLPQARRNAQEALQSLDGCDGKKYANSRAYLNVRTDLANGIANAALFPVALGPWGVSAEGDLKHWGQISDGVFQCALMCTHWEYTLDRAYLKKVWPLLEATANFFRVWCEKEALPDGGYRYNVWDSHWEGSGLVKNSAPALGCAKHLFETLVAVTPVLRELGIRVSDADAAAWKDFAEHLSPLATGTAEVGGRAVRTLSGVEREDGKADLAVGNTITFESVIPGENFSFDVTDAFRALATNAVAAILERGGKSNFTCANQTPKFYATAIRTGYPCAPILAAFKEHEIRPRLQKNFHLRDGVHGVEKVGSIELLQSMLIQCDHGIVKVFPNWNGTNARFERLRTKGAFLVSSEMRDGRVTAVTVTSEKGGRFRLVDPFGGTFVPAGWTRGRTRLSGEPTLERDFAPGETRFEIDPKTGRLDSEQSAPFRPCAELAVWDFDGTILDGDCTEGLVRDGETVYAGLLADCIAAGFARDYRGADGVTRFRRDYEAKIAAGRKLEAYRDCARIFAGANVAELEAFCRRRFRETIEQHLFAYSLRRFRELEASGVENHVVSASADFFVQAAAEVLRVPRARVHGILVKIRDGKLTDGIIEPFPYGDGKTKILRELERTRGGKVRYGFGNSYSTDGPFLKAIAEQGGTATMFNGGKIVKGMTELFVCTNLTETVGAPQSSSPVPISENSRPQPFADKIKSEGQKGFYEDRVPFYLKTWTPTFLADREAELRRLDADLQRAALRTEEVGPIRPGGVDGSPFWNRYGRMFMYPPAFDFKPVAGAVKYRFLIHDREHQCLTHEADRPTAPLTSVWSQLPNGFVAVWCQAVLTNGQTVVTRGDWGTDYRMFWKQAPFKPGTYPKPPRSYGEAAEKFLTWIFDGNVTAFRHFSETGDPHGDWPVGIPINCYPAKIHSALIRAGLDFAVRCPVRRDEAMKLVRAAAEYLQKVSCKPGEPCAGFPPTYEGNSRVCTAYAGQIMMIYPADAGRAYLALAKATGERRWADAARLIGETYLKLQEADGTWPLKVWAKTGKASRANRLQPLAVVDFLEQLFAATGDRRYRDAADRAFAWVERGPMKTWNWEAQYEDAEPSPVPYYNMAGIVACQAVEHVLKRYPGDKNRLAFCREAMRFVEDQFVCWEVPCDANGFGACTLDKLPTNPPYEYRSWTVPCVLEQSTYAVPVSAAAGIVIGAYLSMHMATGDPMDLQRAQAIGDALVCAQRDNGAIPDVIATPYYQCWLNDAYTAVEGLRRLAGRAVPLAGK